MDKMMIFIKNPQLFQVFKLDHTGINEGVFHCWNSLGSNLDEVLKPVAHLPKGSKILEHHNISKECYTFN